MELRHSHLVVKEDSVAAEVLFADAAVAADILAVLVATALHAELVEVEAVPITTE